MCVKVLRIIQCCPVCDLSFDEGVKRINTQIPNKLWASVLSNGKLAIESIKKAIRRRRMALSMKNFLAVYALSCVAVSYIFRNLRRAKKIRLLIVPRGASNSSAISSYLYPL